MNQLREQRHHFLLSSCLIFLGILLLPIKTLAVDCCVLQSVTVDPTKEIVGFQVTQDISSVRQSSGIAESCAIKGSGSCPSTVSIQPVDCLSRDYFNSNVLSVRQDRDTIDVEKLFLFSCRKVAVKFQKQANCEDPSVSNKCLSVLLGSQNCASLHTAAGCATLSQACFFLDNNCLNRTNPAVCRQLNNNKPYCGTSEGTTPGTCTWSDRDKKCLTASTALISNQYAENKGDLLPSCAYSGTCDDVKDVVLTFISIARKLFALGGSFAFLMFIYGGLTMILSFGNADKVDKGKQIIIAAIIGLTIAFGAYALVRFVLEVLDVQTIFRARF